MYALPVKSTDQVLEIGSGHNPHPRSNILVDRYLHDDTQRQRKKIRHDRPLVICKGEQLPFPNKSFDFILCSQILEHTKDPIQFTQEISRVGKAGLIIVPSIIRERLFGWYYHKWMFYTKENTLYFTPKEPQEQTQFTPFMHRLFSNSIDFQSSLYSKEKQLNKYFYWENDINIKPSPISKSTLISDADKQVEKLLEDIKFSKTQNLKYQLTIKKENLSNRYNKLIQSIIWKIQNIQDIDTNLKQTIDLLVCPKDLAQLKKINNNLICSKCKTKYQINNSIPIMLTKDD